MAEKFSKDDVAYSKGHPASHCGPMFPADKGYCKHFIDKPDRIEGECELVKGVIRRSFWCRLWKKAVTK